MTRPKQNRTAGFPGTAVSAALVVLAGWQISALAQDGETAPAGDNAIVASLNPVPDGLSCNDAAAQAQVSFDFQKPDFDIKQVSLYVDGKGVPQDAVTQQWPRITLSSGLHPGRNTVEIVATGDNDRSIARQLTVLIGATPQAGDDNAAIVQCDDSRSQVAETPPAVEQPQQAIEAPPTVVTGTVYIEDPVYVYHQVPAYPVWPVFVPIVPVVIGYPAFPTWYPPRHYCPPPVVTYYPAPPPRRPAPVGYRPPPYQYPPPANTWRTPRPINETPMPVNGVPQPFQAPPTYSGASRPPRGSTFYSTQPPADARWGVVNDMNKGGTGTRYRTPPPPPAPVMKQPYGNAPEGAQHNTHGQQSYWAPMQPMNQSQTSYREPPHQSYVHEAPVQRYSAPHPMAPPRMMSAPSQHGPTPGRPN